VFFALSGYLVYRPFLYRPVEPAPYLIRRTLRMAPAWLAAVVGVRLLMPGEGPALSLVMWSLFVEMAFYAVLPLLALAARQREWLVVGGLGLASFVASLLIPSMLVPVILDPILLPFFFWAFSLGMLLAVLERDRPKLIRPHVWLVAGLLLVPAGLYAADGYSAGFSDPLASLVVVFGAVAVMGALMGWRQRWAWAALGADATYSFYLWHLPVLETLAARFIPSGTIILGLLITGLISVTITVVLEKPIRRWAASWIASRPPRPDRPYGG
jgi:peptidoglycan/LPS O-acetylase OafA/YrhL